MTPYQYGKWTAYFPKDTDELEERASGFFLGKRVKMQWTRGWVEPECEVSVWMWYEHGKVKHSNRGEIEVIPADKPSTMKLSPDFKII